MPALPLGFKAIPKPWTLHACYILYILIVIYPKSWYAVQVVRRFDSQRSFE